MNLLRNPAFRYGLKFGLAGMLAVFIALVGKLQEPTWALFTVYVLMVAQYVGAIAEKSVYRLIGTMVGGLLGYVFTAAFQQNPVIFLTLVGMVVAVSTAMFGQNRYPYAFLLCGLTIVVVVSNGLSDPDNSWTFMLFRIQEVGVGIFAALIVQTFLWPRYARVEFLRDARAAFADLRDCFAGSAQGFFGQADPSGARKAEDFPARINGLRLLLDFGARESRYFRLRLGTYFEITTCLSRIAGNIVTLGETLPEKSFYRKEIAEPAHDLHQAIAQALDNLANADSTTASRAAARETMTAAFTAFEDRLLTLRIRPEALHITPEEAAAIGIHVLALAELRQHISHAHELMDSLPEDPLARSRPRIADFVSPIPPTFWIHAGIKSGVAVVAALVLDNWLNPPGGSMLVLGAWVFTALNAASPDGHGDRRAFQFAGIGVVATLALALLLLAVRPFLSSYAVMNTFIFTWLFVWGYLAFSVRGMTIAMQMGMLFSVGILGLNGQEPISYQAVADFFFGIALALVLAAIVQRILWPSLPQWELRNRLLEFLTLCQLVVKDGPDKLPLWKRARIALIPGEIAQRLAVMNSPLCSVGEPARLNDYLHILQRVGNHLIVSMGGLLPLVPASIADKSTPLITEFEAALTDQLRQHAAGLASGDTFHVPTDQLNELLTRWRAWILELRATIYAEHQTPIVAIQALGLAGRYEQAGRDLLAAADQSAKLHLNLYMGDYIL